MVLIRGTAVYRVVRSKDFSRSFEDFQAGGNIQDFFGNYFDEMTPSVKCAFLYKSVKKILLRTTEKINYV